MEADHLTKHTICMIDMCLTAATLEQAIQLLISGIARTEAQPGCYECRVTQDATDPNRIRYREAWESEDVLQRHIQSEDFRHVLAAIDMCCREPCVIIGNLCARQGIAYLQELHTTRISGSVSLEGEMEQGPRHGGL
jgi:quinol monooxygenase YgiN